MTLSPYLSNNVFDLMDLFAPYITPRKWRLFAVACVRPHLGFGVPGDIWGVLDAAERYADGEIHRIDMLVAQDKAKETPYQRIHGVSELAYQAMSASVDTAKVAAREAASSVLNRFRAGVFPLREAARTLRNIVMPTYRRVRQLEQHHFSAKTQCMAWTIYTNRDWEYMGVLADSVVEDGIDDSQLVWHLRRGEEIGCRGWWSLDVILNKV